MQVDLERTIFFLEIFEPLDDLLALAGRLERVKVSAQWSLDEDIDALGTLIAEVAVLAFEFVVDELDDVGVGDVESR